jgi:REP element-mobilizing transposase RayT
VAPPARYAKGVEDGYDFSDYEKLYHFAKQNTPESVILSDGEMEKVASNVENTLRDEPCRYALASVGPHHVHVLLEAEELSVAGLCKLLKGRSSRVLATGRTWSRGYHKRFFHSNGEMAGAIKYIKNHVKEGAVIREIKPKQAPDFSPGLNGIPE